MKISRRQTFKLALAVSVAALGIPRLAKYFQSRNEITHILSAVSDNRILIKASVAVPREKMRLRVGDTVVDGTQTDSHGRFWAFDIKGLQADQTYSLQLEDDDGVLGDSWPLKTFPDRMSDPEAFRLLTYTCAGGPDGLALPSGKEVFKPIAFRHQLFDAALAMKPDAVIAIGDHVYWDLRGGDQPTLGRGASFISQIAGWYLRVVYGAFERGKPILGTKNEEVLTRIGDEQIAGLYGTRFKSVPVFFVADDHDYFENDDAEKDLVTFPPDTFSRDAHATIARLYYPTFLPDREQPEDLPGAETPGTEMQGSETKGTNRSFGTLRYGKLLEAVLFDCAGYLRIDGDDGGLVPNSVESWLLKRISANQSRHFALVPSHPLGWTAGKWREWYPDVVAPEGFEGVVENKLLEGVKGTLSATAKKYLWQQGWWLQHQRLIKAMNENTNRTALVISGDIHALGAKQIVKSGNLEFSDHRINSFLVGPVGTSDLTWPSSARGIASATPAWLDTENLRATEEVNGFTLFEFTQQGVEARLFDCGGGLDDSAAEGRPRSSATINLG